MPKVRRLTASEEKSLRKWWADPTVNRDEIRLRLHCSVPVLARWADELLLGKKASHQPHRVQSARRVKPGPKPMAPPPPPVISPVHEARLRRLAAFDSAAAGALAQIEAARRATADVDAYYQGDPS